MTALHAKWPAPSSPTPWANPSSRTWSRSRLVGWCTRRHPKIDALRARAERGDADAQYDLGVTYVDGRGVSQDDAEAMRWYRLTAEQGQPPRRAASGAGTSAVEACRKTSC